MACQEMEARLEEKEPASVDRKPEVAQKREVPNKDAVVKPVKGRKTRYRGRKQAAGRRGEPTRDNIYPKQSHKNLFSSPSALFSPFLPLLLSFL
jgi:hypothetical protein